MHFLRASVNARDVDFSDTIATKRKSYRTRTLRTRRRIGRDGGVEEVVVGDSDDEDEDPEESFARKLARLRREAEELKEELERRKKQQDGSQEGWKDEEGEDDSLEELSRTLDALRASARGTGTAASSYSAEAALKRKLVAAEEGKTDVAEKREKKESGAGKSTSSAEPSGLLAHAASFDERLSLIEAAMGISTSSNPFVPSADGEPPLRPVLPTLEQLTSQLTALSSTLGEPAPVSAVTTSGAITASTAPTTSNIETLTSRIKKLTTDADALAAARSRAAAEARRQQDAAAAEADPTLSSPRPGSSSSAQQQQQALQQQRDEQTSKIQALYATLPTIQSLHPLLPSVLERLRSLRALHAGAAQASETLDALEKDQAEMSKEIEAWREGLRVVENKMKENEEAMKKNLDVVGPWVKELEERVARLEQQ